MSSRKEPRHAGRLNASREGANRRRRLLVAIGLCAAALLAYANSFGAGFALDNKALILEDPRVRQATPQNLDLILQHTYWWPHGEAGLYRPITTLSYLFNYAVLGNRDRPAGYHWLNFLLHAGNVLLVFFLVSRLIREFWPPVFAAALWAVHPVLTESVTNIAGRADLLAAAAVLGGFLLYLKSTESAGWRRRAWLAGLMAATAIGVFSKESGVVIPGVIALYECTFWRERKQARGLLLGCLATVPPIAFMLVRRAQVLAASPPAAIPFVDNPIVGSAFRSGRLAAVQVMARYLWLTIWPVRLSSDYSYPQIPVPAGGLQGWLAGIAMLGVVLAVLVLYGLNWRAFFFAGFAFVTFLPVSNLLFPIGTIMAERFLYLPSVGLVVCLVLAVRGICGRMGLARAAPAVVCLVAVAFTVRTWARNADWQDDVTLARSAVEACPRSFKAHKILAAALLASDPGHSNIDAVIDQASRSVALLDSLPDRLNDAAAYRMAGAAYLLKGNRQADEKAVPLLLRCAHISELDRQQYPEAQSAPENEGPASAPNPNDDAYRLLSLAYLRLGQTQPALAQAAAARTREPMNPEVYRQLSSAFLASGQPDEAATALMEGVLLTSDQSLRLDLLDLYRKGLDSTGCAIMPGPNGPAIDPSCGIVHRHLCKAAAEAIQLSLGIGRRDIAESLRHGAAGQLGCASGE
jgi:tetratricopeptide (TPR) repeat protein